MQGRFKPVRDRPRPTAGFRIPGFIPNRWFHRGWHPITNREGAAAVTPADARSERRMPGGQAIALPSTRTGGSAGPQAQKRRDPAAPPPEAQPFGQPYRTGAPTPVSRVMPVVPGLTATGAPAVALPVPPV